jgi:arylsulfatase A-like enzyme
MVLGLALALASLLAGVVAPTAAAGVGAKQWFGLLGGVMLVALGIKGRPSLVPDLIKRAVTATDLPALHLRRSLAWCVLFGVGAGLAETAIHFVQTSLGHRFDYFKPSSVWMSPASYTALLMPAALSLSFAGKFVWSFLGSERVVLFTMWFLVSLGLLLNYHPELTEAAILLLALGMGAQGTRVMERRSGRLLRFVKRRSLAGLVTLLVVEAAVLLGPWVRERVALGQLGKAPADARNVLLVILDTVRAQNLGLYGYGRETTPHLERRARSGVIFDHAYATAPWTLPTHAGIFTGLYPHDLSADHLVPLDDVAPTLAEVFAGNGYRTAGFVANQAYAGPHTGLARGFSRYVTDLVSPQRILGASALGRLLLFPATRGESYLGVADRKEAAVVNRQFLSWISGAGDRPFFAFLNYLDAHAPYEPPPPYDSMFSGDVPPPIPMDMTWGRLTRDVVHDNLRAYDGAIRYLDEELHRLFEELEHRDLLRNTVVIITSDHGEEFAEHGIMRHGQSLYAPVLQVPLVIVGPGIPTGSRIDRPVSVRDLAATAAVLAGIEEHPFPSTSVSRYWRGHPAPEEHDSEDVTVTPPESLILAEVSGDTTGGPRALNRLGNMLAAISARHYYVLREDGMELLFDLQSDPWQQEDLSQDPAREALLHLYREQVQLEASKYFGRTNPLWEGPGDAQSR